jgi:hypothetical protein
VPHQRLGDHKKCDVEKAKRQRDRSNTLC